MTDLAFQPLTPANQLDDTRLRRELADIHRLERVLAARTRPGQHAALRARLAELDAEWLRRYPAARARWPWSPPDAHL